MTVINRALVEECLAELSSRADQLRLWKSTGAPEVSSFSEVLEQLFTDSGLESPLHTGKTGFGKEFERCLLQLEKVLMSINANQDPDKLIDSPEMERVRKLAAEALMPLQHR